MFSLWIVIKNAGLILSFFKTSSHVVREMVKEKKAIPDCQKSKDLIEIGAKLLEKKIIDVPDVDEAEIAKAIRDFKDQITCKI